MNAITGYGFLLNRKLILYIIDKVRQYLVSTIGAVTQKLSSLLPNQMVSRILHR